MCISTSIMGISTQALVVNLLPAPDRYVNDTVLFSGGAEWVMPHSKVATM
ncbi:MAG: hypothetical protein GDA36_03570 [Rhodobacteraceae bacterium]|nr:hypothetical protein [Paracoccaceae bacterium]